MKLFPFFSRLRFNKSLFSDFLHSGKICRLEKYGVFILTWACTMDRFYCLMSLINPIDHTDQFWPNEHSFNVIKVTVWVSFLVGSNTVGPTVLKFGTEDHIYTREVIGYILFRWPSKLGPGVLRPKWCFPGRISSNKSWRAHLKYLRTSQIRSPGHTQVTCSRSMCSRSFPRHCISAVWAETWQWDVFNWTWAMG